MSNLGYSAVFMTMLLSALGGALVLGSKRPRIVRAGERMLLSASVAGTAALFILVVLLLNQDYRVAYVHDYTNRNMGIGYLVTAVWGGQSGSLLFWAVLQTWYTGAVVRFAKLKPKIALGFLAALQVYFFTLVLFHSNPFAPLGQIATSGLGMNPLLLNPYMAFHPPMLFMGFVGFSVPAAYALAMLAEPLQDDEWIETLRPFILFAWLFLSIGNLLGMLWAYQELGWGGYWGWDPVENSSFMPWLTATALVHTSTLQKSKRLFRLLNPVLMIVTFSLIVFGTFITRSGVIESVHAFSKATVGPYLLGLILFMVTAFAALAGVNRKMLVSEAVKGGIFAKESLFLVTAWLLLISAAFIWIGTMAPLFTEVLKGEKVASTPAFFNNWMVPLGLVILATLGFCILFGNKAAPAPTRSDLIRLAKAGAAPLSIGVLTALLGALFFGLEGAAPVIAFGLVGITGAGVLREAARVIAAARRDGTGITSARQRRLGAQVVHFAVVLLFLGFTGSAYTKETSKVMKSGDRLSVDGFELEFKGLREKTDYLKYALFGDLLIRKSGREVGTYSTARFFYHSHSKQPTSEVAIRTTLAGDLFLILGRINEETGDAAIRVVVNPLVAWIWIGGVVLIIGTGVGLTRRRGKTETAIDRRRRLFNILYLLLAVGTLSLIALVAEPIDAALTAVAGALTGTMLLLGSALFGLIDPGAE